MDPELAEEMKGKVDVIDIYKNPDALQPFLLKRARELYDRNLKIGDMIEYYKTQEGYLLAEEVTSMKQLDLNYYTTLADRALAIFKLDRKSLADKKQEKLGFYEGIKVIPIEDVKKRKKKLTQSFKAGDAIHF
jgi:hypothetical protein